jgi:peptidoglycan/xylan/chitin deacetylase (PgdA/CDA1 family)
MLRELLLDAVRRNDEPVPVFFRDDDAGWDSAALRRLLELFRRHRWPLDLAVIPAALDDDLARDLRRRWDAGDRLGLHQHGYDHSNHERVGRKCEFGPARPRHRQLDDLAAGRERLQRVLQHRLDDIFTPPWNRCGAATRSALREIGVRALSQTLDDSGQFVDGLVELPITFDWERPRWPRTELRRGAPIGVMLHHAVLGDEDFMALDALLGEMQTLPQLRPALMRELGVDHVH